MILNLCKRCASLATRRIIFKNPQKHIDSLFYMPLISMPYHHYAYGSVHTTAMDHRYCRFNKYSSDIKVAKNNVSNNDLPTVFHPINIEPHINFNKLQDGDVGVELSGKLEKGVYCITEMKPLYLFRLCFSLLVLVYSNAHPV